MDTKRYGVAGFTKKIYRIHLITSIQYRGY